MLGGRRCCISRECFSLQSQKSWVYPSHLTGGKALAQTIYNRCRHHPGRLQDMDRVFPTPRSQRDEEGALPLPTVVQRLFF